MKLKLRFWSKFESWESLELGELKFILRKKPKLRKVRVWLSPKKKLEKLKLENFSPHSTLRVRVGFFHFRTVKVDLKLAKSSQLWPTLKVGPTFFCLCPWQISGNLYILEFDHLTKKDLVLKDYLQAKSCDIVLVGYDFSHLTIQISCTYQTMAYHWAAYFWNNNIFRNMQYWIKATISPAHKT